MAIGERLPRRLPRLAGLGFQLFRVIWFVALGGAIAGVTIGEIYTYQRIAATSAAFEAYGLHIGVEVPVTLYFPLSAAARRAGIAAGDSIVAIDGKPVAANARPQDIAPLLDRAGAVATIRTRAVTGSVADHRLVRDPRQADETYAGSGLTPLGRELAIRIYDTLTALVMFGAALLLFIRRPRDPVAALLSIAFLLLLASYSWTWLLDVAQLRWPVALLRPTAWTLMNIVLLTFPTGRFEPRWSAVVALALAPIWAFWVFDTSAEMGNAIGVINMVVFLLVIISIRHRYRRLSSDLERQQIKWAVLGFCGAAVSLLAVIVAALIVPVMTINPHILIWAETIRFFGVITMIASLALGLLVSLLRYRLYDADAIISRSAGYALLTLMIGAVWAGGERGIEHVVTVSMGHEAGGAATVIAAALATMLVAPAHNRVHRWAEHRFQKALMHLRHGLPAFVEDMRETAHVHELLEGTLDRIERGVRAVRGAVLLADLNNVMQLAAVRDIAEAPVETWRAGWHPHPHHQHALECDREDPLFPLRLRLDGEAGTLGWILLGSRPDGSFYGRDEREALDEVAEPIARAVIVARRRDARWHAVHAALAVMGERVAAIEAQLAKPLIDLTARPKTKRSLG
jgi:hypothetical protein